MAPIPVLNALADATRCRIIEILRKGPVPVHKLAAGFDISRPAISRHLRVLKEAGLIREEKSGRENHYTLQPRKLAPVRKWLDTIAPPKNAQAAAEPEAEADAVAEVVAIVPAPEIVVPPAVVAPEPIAVAPIEVVPVAEPVVAAAPKVARVKAPKPVKAAEPVEAATASISQLGFDF